ncbi:hypothetical protein PoB_001797500 [Plakobranchus ocellatus]|uniref:Uncharacterized protein n=1 Tax=Plakobranchus ocellatus TaxID=259542 RepID=A0AAV3Z8J4_9GAST|nr:hypothetical protein PoB_001797500 [Plakobranchus ocellatus]
MKKISFSWSLTQPKLDLRFSNHEYERPIEDIYTTRLYRPAKHSMPLLRFEDFEKSVFLIKNGRGKSKSPQMIPIDFKTRMLNPPQSLMARYLANTS